MDAERQSRRVDRLIADLAARQHGVVERAQLAEIGLRKGGLERRVDSGRLHQIYRGVYAVGHPGLTQRGRWMAAVLAAGPGAVLSHRAAAALWELRPGAVPVEVIVPAQRRQRRGLKLRQPLSLNAMT